VVYRPENIVVREKMNRKVLEIVVPILVDIVNDGVSEGCFDNIYPEETAMILLSSSSSLAERNIKSLYALKDNPKEMDSIERRIDFFEFMIQRLLGNSEISIKGFGEELIARMRASIQPQAGKENAAEQKYR
ncbi:MAG: hypothetical protein JW738_03850, partial [Actinobacteria bacterium]|nr:hypothetical protein [Actinomycetota bacterium]